MQGCLIVFILPSHSASKTGNGPSAWLGMAMVSPPCLVSKFWPYSFLDKAKNLSFPADIVFIPSHRNHRPQKQVQSLIQSLSDQRADFACE